MGRGQWGYQMPPARPLIFHGFASIFMTFHWLASTLVDFSSWSTNFMQSDWVASLRVEAATSNDFNTKKGNQKILGIDLLKTQVQKDLLSISILRVEEAYIKILESGDPKNFMQRNGEKIFLRCIKKSCEDFFTKQYGSKVKIKLGNFPLYILSWCYQWLK